MWGEEAMSDAYYPPELEKDIRLHFAQYDKFAAKVLTEFRELQAEANKLWQSNNRLQQENAQLHQQITAGVGSRAEAWENVYTHKGDREVHGVAVRADSKVAASVDWCGRLTLLDLEQVTPKQWRPPQTVTLPSTGQSTGLYAVAFAKTVPSILGVAAADNNVYLCDSFTGEKKDTFSVVDTDTATAIPKAHRDEVNGLDFHHSQNVMCTASDDQRCLIWDFKERTVLRQLDHHSQVYSCTFFSSSVPMQFNIATCAKHAISVYDMRTCKTVTHVPDAHNDDIIGLDFSAANGFLASGSDDGTISLWDHRNWKLFKTIDTRNLEGLTGNSVKRLRFSPDGNQLAAGCVTSCVLVYDGITEEAVGLPSRAICSPASDVCVFDVAWAEPQPGSKMLISGAHDKTTRIWAQ